MTGLPADAFKYTSNKTTYHLTSAMSLMVMSTLYGSFVCNVFLAPCCLTPQPSDCFVLFIPLDINICREKEPEEKVKIQNTVA